MRKSANRPFRVTIQEVARLAEVSVATVSAVINGTVRVSEERTRRVRDAMEALRYRPDERGRILRTGRSRILGVVVPDVTNPFYPEILRKIEKAAGERGYIVLLCDSADNAERERKHLETLLDRRVDGALVACTDSTASYDWLRERPMPVVFFERIPAFGRFAAVSTDHAAASAGATRHLLEIGHTRIAFLLNNASLSSNAARLKAFREALAERGLAVLPHLVVPALAGADAGRRTAAQLLAAPDRPTAFLCSNSVLLLGVAHAVREGGMRCPVDVSLMCFDNPAWTEHFSPAITTRAQDTAMIASTAVEMLVERIGSQEPPSERIQWVPDRLVLRESTGAAPVAD
jgi:LacI family transcriptional regulator